ncbi:hypothetical protein L1987_84073 [Smallanthus sonchifolius]|uniref:Uncharacterized protein n=1 Tax=Smallanthus sonchifolius TaxID=185202 RepID=A0ACB8YDQ7_9ASTR|nr:hypothetical protein L1987_84073 [Smallanthus sonchifolius]
MHLGESVAVARTVGHLSKSAEVMKIVNDLMKAPEMAVKMQEFRVIEEMMNDAVDSALDSDDIEDEIEEEVDKVLTAIAGETAARLPEASRKERLKQHAQAENMKWINDIRGLKPDRFHLAGIAQLGERQTEDLKVTCSIHVHRIFVFHSANVHL